MKNLMTMKDLPKVFISYREGNAEANREDLIVSVRQIMGDEDPKLIYVRGVRGFHAAHVFASKCVREAYPDSTHFVTIDGDNTVMPHFWHVPVVTHAEDTTTSLTPDVVDHGVLSWNSFNPMNGLAYGNGGIKVWTHKFVDSMVTHENSKNGQTVDFCWDPNYIQFASINSYTRPYGSPLQAFTAGFREGAKMPLRSGRIEGETYELYQRTYSTNMRRLLAWCSLGAHVPNGQHAIHGALLALFRFHVEKIYDISLVSDLDFISSTFNTLDTREFSTDSLRDSIADRLNIKIPVFGAKQSLFVVSQTLPLQIPNPYERETWQEPIEAKF